MKRLSVLVFTLTIAMSTFAYYDDYGYSRYSSSFEMPGWLIFMGIVMIIWGVLEIILFFKIWGMTNDIRALKKDHFCETEVYGLSATVDSLRRNLVLGKTENVKRILLQNFIDDVENAYRNLKPDGYVVVNGMNKWISYEEENLKESIVPYVKNLMKQYAKIGEEVPEYITKMETFGDYFGVFIEDDLIVETEKKEEKSE